MSRLVTRFPMLLCLASLGVVLLLLPGTLFAQDSTGGSLSGALSDSTDTAGLDSSYAGGADSLSTNLQSGTSDQGQSQAPSEMVDGSLSLGYQVAAYDTSPYVSGSGQLSDDGSGGHRGSNPQSAAFSSAGSSLAVGGFGGQTDRLAFSGGETLVQMARTRDLASTPGSSEQAAGQSSGRQLGGLRQEVDPVLSLSLGGAEGADLQLGIAPPLPSATLGATFASLPYQLPQYQFDDGRTPLLTGQAQPGFLLGAQLASAASTTGFADSTLGDAGLPTEAQAFAPPAGLTNPFTAGSPFPSLDHAFSRDYEIKPTLHAQAALGNGSYLQFQEYERFMFQSRILLGMDVSQAEWLRRADLRTFERQRQSTLNQGLNDTAPSAEPYMPMIH